MARLLIAAVLGAVLAGCPSASKHAKPEPAPDSCKRYTCQHDEDGVEYDCICADKK